MRPAHVLAVAALAFVGACARPRPPTGERRPHAPTAVRSSVAPAAAPEPVVIQARAALPSKAPATATSVYDLQVNLLADDGRSLGLDAFRGHPLLVTMFYGSCRAACPLITADLKHLESLLPPATRAELRVLMVSFDAERDTPVALHEMKQARGMDPERWTLASASDDAARELAGVLGIRFRKLDNGQFFHSSSIVLLDGGGHERARVDGLGNDPASILKALTAPSS